MSNKLERFRKRKKIRNSYTVSETVDEKLVGVFLNSSLDESKVNSTFDFTSNFYNMKISSNEVEEFLLHFKQQFNDERFNQLIADCKKEVINSIVTPFGLGKVVAAYDKVGGNVTTIHNANQNIYANEKDKYKREDYTNTKNSEGKQFAGQGKNSVGSQYTKSQMASDGSVIDAYTGKVQKADTTSPDHIESLSQYHKNGGFMQNKTQKADFATDENNLALTDRSINQSMRDFNKKDWMEKEKDGIKNKERFDIDEKKLNKAIEKGKETAKEHLPTNLEKARYYSANSITTGVSEGVKMGIQQALGAILVEFFAALFDEITDIYKNSFGNGFDDKRFINVLKERIKRIGLRLTDKWKDFIKSFKDGAISGFISNLVTTFTNMFITTGKRIVRVVREGIFSLFRAIKILLFPPENLSFSDALHEAKKLIASGLIISVGVILEEYVDTLIKTTVFLEPFADVLTTILIGGITGIAVSLAVYYIDKKRNDKELFNNLVCDTDKKFDELEQILSCKIIKT
jgi:hypothetical protein